MTRSSIGSTAVRAAVPGPRRTRAAGNLHFLLPLMTLAGPLLWSGCQAEPKAPTGCSDDRECLPEQHCVSGVCTMDADPQGTECTATAPCTTGQCLVASGLCVECIHQEDCTEPGAQCTSEHRCAIVGTACTDAECAAAGQVCSVTDGLCRACEADAECGAQLCLGGACTACSTATECGTGRTCAAGLCVFETGTPCATNTDCGELICVQVGTAKECMPCLIPNECDLGRTCTGDPGRCIADSPECTTDDQCSPPDEICQGGLCILGCSPGTCAEGQACNQSTGRCVVATTQGDPLGDACTTHEQCLSGLCWPTLAIDGAGNTQLQQNCARACSQQSDCPFDSICWELGDGNYCRPKASTDWPDDFNGAAGDACGGDFINLSCRSGYCGTTDHVSNSPTCMETCGRDADCADQGLRCVSNWPVGADSNGNNALELGELDYFTQLCHQDWGDLPDHAACGSTFDGSPTPNDHDRCASGWCVHTPDRTQTARCAEPCCSPADCAPGYSVCKPIDVFDGIRDTLDVTLGVPYTFQKVCLWTEYVGATKDVGDLCTNDTECKSEICAAGPSGEKRCTHTCCTNADCAAYDWAQSCRPPFIAQSSVDDLNFEDIALSLGRRAIPSLSNSDKAFAVTPLCLPR